MISSSIAESRKCYDFSTCKDLLCRCSSNIQNPEQSKLLLELQKSPIFAALYSAVYKVYSVDDSPSTISGQTYKAFDFVNL